MPQPQSGHHSRLFCLLHRSFYADSLVIHQNLPILPPKYLPNPYVSLHLYGPYPKLGRCHISLGYCNWSFCLYFCLPSGHSPCFKSNFSKAWIDHATALLRHLNDCQLFKMTCKALHELVLLTSFLLSQNLHPLPHLPSSHSEPPSVLLTCCMLPDGGASMHCQVGRVWLLHIHLYPTSHVSTLRRYFRFTIAYFLTFCSMATWLLSLTMCVSESSSTIGSKFKNDVSLSKIYS